VLSFFISHPEVAVDAGSPIEQWGLSESGQIRAGQLSGLDWARGIRRIVSSTERKAMETAAILGSALSLTYTTDRELGENDRSATGFLPLVEFEAAADEFFARPSLSVSGWETAAHAQARIVAAVRRLSSDDARPTAFVAHGAVGTLLFCDLVDTPISREHDQPGQGSYFSFDASTWTAMHRWRRIEM
jgi:broad specificity phosphatase PhoE